MVVVVIRGWSRATPNLILSGVLALVLALDLHLRPSTASAFARRVQLLILLDTETTVKNANVLVALFGFLSKEIQSNIADLCPPAPLSSRTTVRRGVKSRIFEILCSSSNQLYYADAKDVIYTENHVLALAALVGGKATRATTVHVDVNSSSGTRMCRGDL